jgi:putative peptide zinc metalloprotease protein
MIPIPTAGARPLDTSERRPVYLLPVTGGSYLRLSGSAYQLLRRVEAGASFDQLAAATRGADGRAVTAGELEAAYGQIADRVARAEHGAHLTGGFWLRVTLLPAALVRPLAALGALAYRPAVAATLLVFLLAGGAMALAEGSARLPAGGAGFWPGYLLFVASLLAHELGHASACARFGAPPSEIGFVLYLVYPSFYSNVSAAWTLPRRQRLLVDLGGVYFQLLFGAALALVHAVAPWPPLRVALAFIAGSCLLSLNPLLKFDGYWVLADALGVTNLRQQTMRLAGRLVRRLRPGARAGAGPAAAPIPWPARVLVPLALYSAVSLAFLAWFLWLLVPVVASLAARFPGLLAQVAGPIARGSWPAGPQLSALASATYVLLFAGIMLARLARQLWTISPRRKSS